MDIVVTTPKNQMASAAREATACIVAGGGEYHRKLHCIPQKCGKGSKVFYVEDGYIRGFAVVKGFLVYPAGFTCDTTGQVWPPGAYVVLPADSWKWIKPIPMKGFQGWRYFDHPFEVIGGWLDEKPSLVGWVQYCNSEAGK
jgi:hypothetical protein